ncbi:WbqC family protein [Porphyromonas macacae]|uniref:WbqC family protein n=1 Tax=Porphyromonas macacae TaxID=28115 RepID=UPI0035A0EF7F
MLLATAYAPPVQYFTKLFAAQGDGVIIEAHENFVKQSYRNRCVIMSTNGPMALSIPLQHDDREKVPITEIKISEHGNWRHLHKQAIISAYGSSPFFEYYWDDIEPLYEKNTELLWDFNLLYLRTLVTLSDLDVHITASEEYIASAKDDYRTVINPRKPLPDKHFEPQPYYQLFQRKGAFQPNLSILDLLFNMGPESPLILRDSIR